MSLMLLGLGLTVGLLISRVLFRIRDRRRWTKMFGTTRNYAYRKAHTIKERTP